MNIKQNRTSTSKSDFISHNTQQLLAIAWLVLVGGRWVVAPVLQATRILKPQLLATLDSGILLKLYLALTSVIVIVTIMRFTRNLEAPSSTVNDETSQPNPQDLPERR